MEKGQHGSNVTRRTFLAMAGAVGAAAFLYSNAPQVAAAIASSSTKLIWLRGSGCGGCTASFLNGGNKDVLDALSKIKLELAYHDGLMLQQGLFVDGSPANTGDHNSNIMLKDLIAKEKYVLVMEGAIPYGPENSGKYCMSGALPVTELFSQVAASATAIIAMGTCASYGGISATLKAADAVGVAFSGTTSLGSALSRSGINKNVINVPGCPAHPDWVLLTLADVLAGNDVAVDRYGRPAAFFGSCIHDSCPRRGAFDRAGRDEVFADGNCLYDLGCKGPLAYADCPTRRWNGGVNMCTQSGGPCVACVEPGFPGAFMPFFKKSESKDIFSDIDVNTGAKIILGAAVIGAGIHAVKRIAIGESGQEDKDEREGRK